MKRLSVFLALLLVPALIAATGCAIGEEPEANASNGEEVVGEVTPHSYYLGDADILGGGGGGGVFAVAMFVKVDGINGESTDDAHKDWIEVINFSHGISRPVGGLTTSTGRLAERAEHGVFTVVKTIDKASPKLALMCCNGQHIPEVTLELCRAEGGKDTYMEYKMTDVIVSSVSVGGSTAGDETLLVEEVSFSYSKIEWTYTEFDDAGKAKGNVEAQWDVSANSGG